MSKKSKQTHVYDSDSNVDAYEEGECKIGVDESLQMKDGVDVQGVTERGVKAEKYMTS